MGRNLRRNVALGALIGAAFGIIFYFIFPNLLSDEFTYNIIWRKELGLSEDYYSPQAGSIYTVGVLIPLVFALIGAVLGYVYYLIRHKLLKV